MNKRDRNLEALSAYLDGELTGNDRERIEKVLQGDEGLQSWFEELKRTRSVLRSTPALRAPRNYYLTPEMVGQKTQPARAFPVLRFASALAAFLLVLLFLGDLFVIPGSLMAPVRSIQIAETIQLVEEAEDAEAFASQAPALPEEPMMQEAPVAEAPAAESAAPMEEAPLLEAEPAVEGMPEAEAEADENISAYMDSARSTEKSLLTQIPPPSGEEEKLGAAAGPTGEGQLDIAPDTSNELGDEEIRPVLDLRSFVRYAEFALLVIAVATGIAAFILFRRTRTH